MTLAAPPMPGAPAAPHSPVLHARPEWREVDFISDLHLQATEISTFEAWKRYMRTTQADAIFILGDLFEVWVGDDVISYANDGSVNEASTSPSFEGLCAQVIKDTSSHRPVFFMHGNRDFLLGSAFATACGMTLLVDPTVLDFAEQRWVLSHGDALCLDDTDYMQFRQQVRSHEWQKSFLAKSLSERQQIARTLRQQSETRKQQDVTFADLDTRASCQWINSAQAATLIHGHTHKPGEHAMESGDKKGFRRIVLSDWDAVAVPPRLEVLRISKSSGNHGATAIVRRFAAHQTT
jgi:UDP-2,3-diacylglucosamine hydrolase